MLDPAIIEALSYTQAFRSPAVVRDVSDAMGEVEVFRATELKVMERDERATEEWIAHGQKLRDSLWSAFLDHPDKGRFRDALDRAVDLTDETTRREGKDLARASKRHRRWVKQAFAASPQRGAVMRELSDRLLALLHRRHEEKLDFSAFLRALRAEADPASRGGPTFGDPSDIDAFLKTAA